ncbi:ABC transporter permease [Actinomycetospora aeridis]|uniref:ABC transporter permease n=1 Tax=Actinomycetospora aeridis TaxID=3129231 RepID=UPI0035A0A598
MTSTLEPTDERAEAAESPAPRPRRGRRRSVTLIRGSAAVIAFLAVWEVVPRLGLVDRVFLPPFSEVLAAWWQLAVSGELGEHLGASLVRALGGLVLAVVVAIPLGIALGWYRPVAEALNPLLEIFRNTAALALLPVFVLLLGLGESSKIALVMFACSWPILLNTASAVRTVDPLLVRSARSLGFGAGAVFRKVVLPSTVPTLFTGVRLAAAVSLLVLVAAEMAGANAGLGYLITAAQFNVEVPQMYAGILTISLLGLAINQLLVVLERRVSRWRPATG